MAECRSRLDRAKGPHRIAAGSLDSPEKTVVAFPHALPIGGPAPTAGGVYPGEGGRAGGDYHPERSFFEGLDEPFGPHEIRITTGGLSAQLRGLSSRQKAELAARYGIFARDRGAAHRADLEVAFNRSPREAFLRVRRSVPAETYRLLAREDGDLLVAWSYEWAASWDRAAGRATVAAASDERVVFDRIVENFLRVAFAHLAIERGALLLHGAGVVREGRAWIFFGPSGSGKTTVTTLSGGAHVLSDDLVMIVPSATPGARYAACSVPFRGLLTPGATIDRNFPLAGLFRLVQDSEDRIEGLDTPRAVGELVQSLPFVTDCPGTIPAVLEVASAVAGSVPVSRLHFTKGPGFWKVIEDVGRSAA